MRQSLVTALVAVMVVSAGCSAIGLGGDGSAGTTAPEPSTPDEGSGGDSADAGSDGGDSAGTGGDGDGDSDRSTGTTVAGTATPTPTPGGEASAVSGDLPPGVEDGKVTNASRLVSTFYGHLGGRVTFDMTFRNSTGNDFRMFTRNDTETQLYRITHPNGTRVLSYYVTPGADGKRNFTTGETTYGTGDSRIQQEAAFLGLVLIIPGQYINVMEWEVTGTGTVDGEETVVLESDAINRTQRERAQSGFFRPNTEVDAVSGRMEVSPDGVIRTATINATVPDSGSSYEIGISFTTTVDDDTPVEQPSWFDESEASESSDE